MDKLKNKQNKNRKGGVGCLVIVIVFLIVISSGLLIKIYSPNSSYEVFLKKIGFSSVQEFEEFSKKLNAEFDDSQILINVPTDEDNQSVKQVLKVSATLKDSGQSIFDENDNLKIDEISEQGISLNDDLSFSDKEFASLINLFVVSLDKKQDISASDVNLRQVNYQYIDVDRAKFAFFVDLDTSKIKEKYSQISSAIPQRLLFDIAFDLDISGQTPTVSSGVLKVNMLDQTTNEKLIDVLAILMDKTHQQVMDMFAGFINDFICEVFNAMNCKMQLNNAIINLIRNE